MSIESIKWDGNHLDVRVDARNPYRACGIDGIEVTYESSVLKDEHGHAIAFVHLREHVAAWAAISVIHALHQPNPEGIVPWCPTCKVPAPCETRRATTAVMQVKP